MTSRVVGFHARGDEYEKIKRLAITTNRSIAGVLRTLVAQAEVASTPDIRLREDRELEQAGARA